MTTRRTGQAARAFAALAGLALAGCTGNIKQDVAEAAIDAQKGPEAPVQRTITNFDEALQCMDMLLIDNGIRDVVILTEDLVDNTKKANVGTRDMMISAVSDMTRRSRAIRLITFGSDVKNLQDWLKNSGGHQSVYNFQPDYNIRGSLSQMDEGLASGQEALGVQLGPISGGKQSSASTAVVGLDLSIMSTKSMELLPGVTSKNSVLLQRSGEGTNFGLNYSGGQKQGGQQQQQGGQQQGGQQQGGMQGNMSNKTFGINYNFSINRSEGIGGGVRNLVELATIELFGKLLRIPYWQCLGVNNTHAMVKREIGDWYYNLVAEGKLVAYMQNQLRIMGRYNGPINGQINKELREVLQDLAAANNIPEPQSVDEPLFSYVLNLRNKNVKGSAIQLAHLTDAEMKERFAKKSRKGSKTRAIGDSKYSALQPINVEFVTDTPSKTLRNGDPLSVTVKTSRDAYLYCYLTSANDASTMRIFPNPRTADPLVLANQTTTVPGDAGLAMKVDATSKSVACFASDTDPAMAAGQELVGRGFEMQQRHLENIRTAIGGSADAHFGEARFIIRKR